MKRILCLFLSLASTLEKAPGQTSTSYKLTESTLNAGGDPQNSSYAASASYRIKLDAIGEALIAVGLYSASFHLDAGFVEAYPPPKEILNLRWTSQTALAWDPELSVGSYDLYRDLLSTLPGGFGACFQAGIGGETWTDATIPSVGSGLFYLVTARNRLAEEGTKGHQSNGAERPNPSPCP
jgi:hypothetical protein